MLQAGRCTSAIRTFIAGRHNSPSHVKRTFTQTPSSQLSLSLTYPFGGQPAVKEDYVAKTRRQKYNALLDSLSRELLDPNRAWANYVGLLDCTRDEHLPLQVHQSVLRKCTPVAQEVRTAYVKRLYDNAVSSTPHLHEARFLTIINNIRRAGWTPELDDYHFILAQFAAVGHYVGAMQILQEVGEVGLEPRTKTHGLCLRAIAFRLTLPCPANDQDKLRDHCARLCLQILHFIQKRNQTVPSFCLDLAHRIMKDTGDSERFMSLLKVSYGIDLEYPDRHPLDSEVDSKKIVPLSTAALTTLVDFLGRKKLVSKMVVAFEVLSTPLETGSTGSRSQGFDDEDEDELAFHPVSISPSRPLPSARPNITTYNTLIRHCAHSMHSVFAKHYVLQATELDQLSSFRLQEDVWTKPMSEILRPELQVNVDTFRPILGLATRDRDVELLKWLMGHVRMVFRKKRENHQFFYAVQALSESTSESERIPTVDSSHSSTMPPDTVDKDKIKSLLAAKSTPSFFTPASHTPFPLSFGSANNPPGGQEQANTRGGDHGLSPTPILSRPKTFDLSLHVRLLQRDIIALRYLDERIGTALALQSTRKKERLGRRIWKDKNIYLRDVGRRERVEREHWREMVSFGGVKAEEPSQFAETAQPVIFS